MNEHQEWCGLPTQIKPFSNKAGTANRSKTCRSPYIDLPDSIVPLLLPGNPVVIR